MTPERRAAQRIAVLIDADQFSLNALGAVMDEVKKRGTVVVLRAYRHWTEPMRKGWADAVKKYGVELVEQAPGRNATDMALAIDAVDLMHERGLDGFVIVSNDKDFAALAGRLRRGRLRAVLMANPKKADPEYRGLWDDFYPLASCGAEPAPAKTSATKKAQAAPDDKQRIKAYQEAIAAADRDGRWARLSDVGKRVPPELRPKAPAAWLRGRPEFKVEKRKFKNSAKDTDCVRMVGKT